MASLHMKQDQTFRLVLIIGTLIVMPVMLHHRLQSQATGEKLDSYRAYVERTGRFLPKVSSV